MHVSQDTIATDVDSDRGEEKLSVNQVAAQEIRDYGFALEDENRQ